MLVDEEDGLHRAAHSNLLVLLAHPLEPGLHRVVLLRLGILGAKRVICERIPGEGKNERKISQT